MKKKIINYLIIMGIAALLVGFDQLTKYLASNSDILINGGKITLIKNVISLRLTYNTGAAFSMLSGKKIFLVSVSLIASIGVSVLLYFYRDFKKNPLLTIALILILAGTVGNFIDRAFYKKGVIDFFYLEFIDFAIFNVADSFLTVGAILLVIYIIFFYRKNEQKSLEEDKQLEKEKDENA